MDWKALTKFVEMVLENEAVRIFIGLWIAERFQALASERNRIAKKTGKAIDYGEQHPGDPHAAKSIMGDSREGRSVEFNSALDAVSPLLFGKKRVSTKKKIWRGFLKVLPIISRFV